jgi:hypothetical protein
MNLEHCVRRIESFLSTVDTPENWEQVSQKMLTYTLEITPESSNPFKGCSTKDEFCNACQEIANKLCNTAASEFQRKYEQCCKECETHRQSIDMDEIETDEQRALAEEELNQFVDDKFNQLYQSIPNFPYHVENAFHLYYYADMLQTPVEYPYPWRKREREQWLTHELWKKQAAYVEVKYAQADDPERPDAYGIMRMAEIQLESDNSTRITKNAVALSLFPQFKALVSQLDDTTDDLFQSFL